MVLNYVWRNWWEDFSQPLLNDRSPSLSCISVDDDELDGEVEPFAQPRVDECDPQPGPSMPRSPSPPEIKPNPEALIDDGDTGVGNQEPFVICRPRTAAEFYALLREQ